MLVSMKSLDYIGMFFVLCLVRDVYMAELELNARRHAYRDGTHDYYGNKIEKSENNG